MKQPENSPTAEQPRESTCLEQIRDDALSLEAAYPDYYEMRGLSAEDAVSLASQRLVARGIGAAKEPAWTRHHVDTVTIRVLAEERLLQRLVELLDSRGDIQSGLRFGRSRGCNEHEALDAVEDAIVSLVQRGHGLKAEDTLLRFFRTILWEKVSDLLAKKTTRAKLDDSYSRQVRRTRQRLADSV